MKEYHSGAIGDDEILKALEERPKAQEAGVQMREVRRELEHLFPEPGVQRFSVELILSQKQSISAEEIESKKKLIALAIRNVLAKRSAERRARYPRSKHTKRDKL